jgi:hypothetical protein
MPRAEVVLASHVWYLPGGQPEPAEALRLADNAVVLEVRLPSSVLYNELVAELVPDTVLDWLSGCLDSVATIWFAAETQAQGYG